VAVVTVAIDRESGKVAGRPRIMTRGVVDSGGEQTLIEAGQDAVLAALNHDRRRLSEPTFVDTRVKDTLSRFFHERIHRRPLIIPVVVNVGKTQKRNP